MSGIPANGYSGGSDYDGDDDGFGFQEAFKIVGIIMLFMIICLFLRYCCNVSIDLLVLCDPYEAQRTTVEYRDWLFPCFKRRLVNPNEVQMTAGVPGEQPSSPTNNVSRRQAADASSPVDVLLQRLSPRERQEVIERVFQGQPAKKQDLDKWRDGHKDLEDPPCEDPSALNNSSNLDEHAISCSICLHDFAVGDSVFVSPPCHHVFHRSCIVEWCSTNHTLCPYCRTQMMTEAQIQNTALSTSNGAMNGGAIDDVDDQSVHES